MDIERQIKDMGKMINYVFTRNKEDGPKFVEFVEIDNGDTFEVMLQHYLYTGDLNSADNLIFNELDTNPSTEVLEIAKAFYHELLTRSDEELRTCDFSKVEVYQSLEDLKKYQRGDLI